MPIDESRAAQAIRLLLESGDVDADGPELRDTPARVSSFL